MIREPEKNLQPKSVQQQGFTLLTRCVLPVLIAALLLFLLQAADDSVSAWLNERAVASVAHLHPGPEPAKDSEEMVDYVFAAWDYKYALNQANLNYGGMGLVISLVFLLLQVCVKFGLFRTMLFTYDRGFCPPSMVFSGFYKGGWRTIRAQLIVLLWMLLATLILGNLASWLESILSVVGAVLGILVLLGVLLWLNYRYVLAFPVMADEAHDDLNARECLHQGIDAFGLFTMGRLLRVLWPVFVLHGLNLGLQRLLPGMPWTLATDLLGVLIRCVEAALLVAVYRTLTRPNDA